MNNNFIPNMGNNMNFIPNMGNISMPMMNPYQDRMDRYNNLMQQQNITNNQQSNNNSNMNFVVVENMQKAKEQIVPCGYTMWMRDSNEPYQYIKSVDQVGTPSFKVLKVEDITDLTSDTNKEIIINDDFVSTDEFKKLDNKVEQLQTTINYFNEIINEILIPNEQQNTDVAEPKDLKKFKPTKMPKLGKVGEE